ncbi:putative coiled-coil protein SlyX [Bradyrhizobium sp. AZCC 2262]
MTNTSEKQSQTEQPESTAPTKKSSRKSVLALAVLALGINSTAAFYTMSPSDFALPDISSLAELLPHQKASDPIADPAVAALKDIHSAQQQHAASLQENNFLLQQNTALLQQDSITLASLRQSVGDGQAGVKKLSTQIADEHEDVKKVSAQISRLIAKVDSLQNAITPEVTSSISARHAQNRLSRVARKKMAPQPKPVGPFSLGGAPLSPPATTPIPQG